jgi:hypothetical protein
MSKPQFSVFELAEMLGIDMGVSVDIERKLDLVATGCVECIVSLQELTEKIQAYEATVGGLSTEPAATAPDLSHLQDVLDQYNTDPADTLDTQLMGACGDKVLQARHAQLLKKAGIPNGFPVPGDGT